MTVVAGDTLCHDQLLVADDHQNIEVLYSFVDVCHYFIVIVNLNTFFIIQYFSFHLNLYIIITTAFAGL